MNIYNKTSSLLVTNEFKIRQRLGAGCSSVHLLVGLVLTADMMEILPWQLGYVGLMSVCSSLGLQSDILVAGICLVLYFEAFYQPFLSLKIK